MNPLDMNSPSNAVNISDSFESQQNTIEKTIKATHFDKTSSYARQQLQTQLVVLKSSTDALLNTLKEISYV